VQRVFRQPSGRSLGLAAFDAQIDPLDRFARLRRSRLTQPKPAFATQNQAVAGAASSISSWTRIRPFQSSCRSRPAA
jgi:hypothetical protein